MPIMPMRKWRVRAVMDEWECDECNGKIKEKLSPETVTDNMKRVSKRCFEFVMLRGKTSKAQVRDFVMPEVIGGLVRRVEIAKDLPRKNAIDFLRETTDRLAVTGFPLPGYLRGVRYNCGHPVVKKEMTFEVESTSEDGAKVEVFRRDDTWGYCDVRLTVEST